MYDRHQWDAADCLVKRCVDDKSMQGRADCLVKSCVDDRSICGHADCLVKHVVLMTYLRGVMLSCKDLCLQLYVGSC